MFRKTFLLLIFFLLCTGCFHREGNNRIYVPGRKFRYLAETFRGDTLLQKAYLTLSVQADTSPGIRITVGGNSKIELSWKLDSIMGRKDTSFRAEEVLADEESGYELGFPGKLFDFIPYTRPLVISSRDLDTVPVGKEQLVVYTLSEGGSVSVGTEREVFKNEKLSMGGTEFKNLVKVISTYKSGKRRIEHIYFFDSNFGFISSQYFLGSRKSVVLTLLPPF